MEEKQERIVLCGASAYEQKFYFNPLFQKVPESIQEELRVICVLFTEEAGGIITFIFEPDGALSIETGAEENDFYYDEISSGLLVGKISNVGELKDFDAVKSGLQWAIDNGADIISISFG